MENLQAVIEALSATFEFWVLVVAVGLYWSMTGRGVLRVGPKVPRWFLLIVSVLGAIVTVFAIQGLIERI
jgi:hypothetical protein